MCGFYFFMLINFCNQALNLAFKSNMSCSYPLNELFILSHTLVYIFSARKSSVTYIPLRSYRYFILLSILNLFIRSYDTFIIHIFPDYYTHTHTHTHARTHPPNTPNYSPDTHTHTHNIPNPLTDTHTLTHTHTTNRPVRVKSTVRT